MSGSPPGRLRVALALADYFPHGGAQRDCVRLATACAERGHAVRLYAARGRGDPPAGFDFRRLRVHAASNHGRVRAFGRALLKSLESEPADVVVGFNRLPGLDVHFAVDPPFADRSRLRDRLTPRGRGYRALERAVFDPDRGAARILVLTPRARERIRAHYATPAERLIVLPPEVASDRLPPPEPEAVRLRMRAALGIASNAMVMVQVAAHARTKGVDRTLRAFAMLHDRLRGQVALLVVGGAPLMHRWMGRRLGASGAVFFLGARDDVPELLQAADLMVHPARREASGTVLLESVAAGVPVIASAACGYGPWLQAVGAGRVLDEPFRQAALNEALRGLCDREARGELRAGALAAARRLQPGSAMAVAVDAIEAVGAGR